MQDLTKNFLLQSLDTRDRALLQATMRPVSLVRDTTLFEAGDAVDRIYFIGEGLVAMITTLGDGGVVQTAMAGRESAIGFVEACGGRVMHSRVVVQISGWAWMAPAVAYRAAFDHSPTLRKAITQHIELLLTEARQEIACQARHSAQQRFARWLLVCRDKSGAHEMAVTQEFLAGLVGTRRTTITEAATGFRKRGRIAYRRGRIKILDRAGFESEACECYDAMKGFRSEMNQPAPLD